MKIHHESRPSVAVITVCRNAISDLQVTAASVQSQVYSPLLHIVVDGCSTDGTVEWLHQHRHNFVVSVSEPDQGIYDAMNKAVFLSPEVDWLIFLNAGDTFHSDDTINRALPKLQCSNIDFVFGDVCISNTSEPRRYKTYTTRRGVFAEMPGCHQSCFVRATLMKRLKFDLRYRVAGDFEFWLRASQRSQATTAFVDHTIATIAPEGFSARNEPILQLEYMRAINEHIGLATAALWLLKRKLRRIALKISMFLSKVEP